MNRYFEALGKYLEGIGVDAAISAEIIKCYRIREYKKNEYFASIGSISNKLGFVAEGLFSMHVIQPDGTLFTKEFINDGRFLLAEFNPEKESNVNIQAIQNSVVLEANYSDILELLSKHEELDRLSRKRMEKEMEAICGRMAEYATMPAKERYMKFKRDFNGLEEDIPQYMIASYLGITPTQLSRIRSEIFRSINKCK